MHITDNPVFADSAKTGKLPSLWCGESAVDGAKMPWSGAPLGSQYTRVASGNVSIFLKTANNGANADWLDVAANTALS